MYLLFDELRHLYPGNDMEKKVGEKLIGSIFYVSFCKYHTQFETQHYSGLTWYFSNVSQQIYNGQMISYIIDTLLPYNLCSF